MKIIIAPDSFKGSLRATKVARTLAAGWLSQRPDDSVLPIPLADGGEGSCEALITALGGEIRTFKTHNPLMLPIMGSVGVAGEQGVLETAAANGIELLAVDELNPDYTTSYGAGELLKSLLDVGCRNILIGIGGSATIDGGVGMLQALGMKFYDSKGVLLPPGAGGKALGDISKVDKSDLDSRLAMCSLNVACDVTNPLLGKNGAAAVFGPQKGANSEQIVRLEANLAHWAGLWNCSGDMPGDGAAGGLGFMLRNVLGAKVASGAQLIMEFSGFSRQVPDADLVITGEGCSDDQTAGGKLCGEVEKCASNYGVPTILCSGAIKGNLTTKFGGFKAVFSIASGPGSLDEAMANTELNLFRAGANLAGIFSIKNKVREDIYENQSY